MEIREAHPELVKAAPAVPTASVMTSGK